MFYLQIVSGGIEEKEKYYEKEKNKMKKKN
jgi:hypothetical protein